MFVFYHFDRNILVHFSSIQCLLYFTCLLFSIFVKMSYKCMKFSLDKFKYILLNMKYKKYKVCQQFRNGQLRMLWNWKVRKGIKRKYRGARRVISSMWFFFYSVVKFIIFKNECLERIKFLHMIFHFWPLFLNFHTFPIKASSIFFARLVEFGTRKETEIRSQIPL